jgi:hypothetical protein
VATPQTSLQFSQELTDLLMINPARILSTLDRNLDHRVDLVIYGRAAIALGFDSAPDAVKHSFDVDAIIPVARIAEFQADQAFWDAQDATNAELEEEGLYITHLFEADQVFLRRDWEQHLVPISRPKTQWLRLFRPATLDLVLTKMMRGDDAQDMEDIAFLVAHDKISPAQLETALSQALIPELQELQEAFELAKPRVRAIVKANSGER